MSVPADPRVALCRAQEHPAAPAGASPPPDGALPTPLRRLAELVGPGGVASWVWAELVGLVVPPACVACRAPVRDGRERLCVACRAALPWLRGPRCARCALPLPCA